MPFQEGRSGNPAGRPVSVETLVAYFAGSNLVVTQTCRLAQAGDPRAIATLREAYANRFYSLDDGHGSLSPRGTP